MNEVPSVSNSTFFAAGLLEGAIIGISYGSYCRFHPLKDQTGNETFICMFVVWLILLVIRFLINKFLQVTTWNYPTRLAGLLLAFSFAFLAIKR